MIKDLQLRYRPDLDLVLRGISCRIEPGQKLVFVEGKTYTQITNKNKNKSRNKSKIKMNKFFIILFIELDQERVR